MAHALARERSGDISSHLNQQRTRTTGSGRLELFRSAICLFEIQTLLQYMKTTPPKRTARVTVREIAQLAGVTIGTVSTVLTNRHVERRIPMKTVEKVRATASHLGYLPDLGARRLRNGNSRKHEIVIAFVTSFEAPLGVVNQFLSALHRAATADADSPHGRTFSLLIEMFAADQLSELRGLLTGDHFNAALIANTTLEDDIFLERNHLPFPAVLINRSVPGYSCVDEDPSCGSQAAELLIRMKRTRLAVLHGRPLTYTPRTRVDSFLAATNRLSGRSATVIEADTLSEAGAHAAMTKFYATHGEIDGLYTVTDSLALGAYSAIKKRGLKIPDDVSVVGVGDYETAPYFDPPLTCVGVSRDEIGERASQLLLHLLDHPGSKPAHEQIPVRAVLRESTGHRPSDKAPPS